jgi:imidazole glycerol phosphate synthase subunit HisF
MQNFAAHLAQLAAHSRVTTHPLRTSAIAYFHLVYVVYLIKLTENIFSEQCIAVSIALRRSVSNIFVCEINIRQLSGLHETNAECITSHTSYTARYVQF